MAQGLDDFVILITGAQGVVGQPLAERLKSEGKRCLMVSRSANHKQASWLRWDLNEPADQVVRTQLAEVSTLIHCAPIWLLPPRLADLSSARLTRLVVFSSTSVLSKQGSANTQEQVLVQKLADAEAAIQTHCDLHKLHLTILRPSMIYGYGLDQNVMHIARFIRKYRFMPLVGAANGGRQPVHAEDLVSAALRILQDANTYSKTYSLAGGEVLTYRAMVERICRGVGQSPRILSIPLGVFRTLLMLASKIGRFDYTPEMANRMSQDLCYDISPAQSDFGYSPQAFLLNPQRDLSITGNPLQSDQG
ncbi:NAD-dependent epimerase/dehydratase family protein [Arenicella xantha]|uniref:Nucleoside-diphosphate-sugar epimerase n=1 Tax=Arenicella xantha TaxID=644221 RepID=A0A395JHT1_9GAMM|nr:NAD-dependent epimerase/dehydratase family protein [Arenicella xantha]RBP48443.1 nucleoside-diphosphate-sugar epimerase [Arenicella xantha]